MSQNVVSGDYFRATGIAVRDGRDFGPADLAGAAPVAIVNEAFVARYLAGRVALGARIDISGTGPVTIVGVVATSKYDDYTESPKPIVFRPYAPGSAPRRSRCTSGPSGSRWRSRPPCAGRSARWRRRCRSSTRGSWRSTTPCPTSRSGSAPSCSPPSGAWRCCSRRSASTASWPIP
ncbi:MAG: ABC transporter permease [Gemmatimonadetes bacterium]|nr:ABC transporter permease [Gemmatimonadota bacterium]